MVATVVLLRQAELLVAKQTLSLLSYSRKKQLSHSLTVLLQKSDLTKAVKFSIRTEMASSLNTTPSGSKGATPSSSSLNRLSTASTEGKTDGSKLRSANPSQYVKLNVGGSLHYTTIGTLTKVDNTYLPLAHFGKRLEANNRIHFNFTIAKVGVCCHV